MTLENLSTRPFVTVVVPVLNEAGYIESCLCTLLPQLDPTASEVFVMDGGSTDGTQDIVKGLSIEYSFLRLVHNPQRIQSAACNLAARLADPRSTVLLRADAHAGYPTTFVQDVLHALTTHRAASVVVPMQTLGRHGLQKAIAAAQNSKLGNGGSSHRSGGVSGPVDHGHHAAFDLGFFKRLQGYNEAFTHNEDAEYDVRVQKAGGMVWMCREAAILYYPRSHLWPLAKQYARHGAGRARTLMTHHLRPRPRQMAPVVILAGTAGSLLLAMLWPVFLLVPTLYLGMCVGWGLVEAARRRDASVAGMGLAAAVMHHGWAFGFLQEVVRRLVKGPVRLES